MTRHPAARLLAAGLAALLVMPSPLAQAADDDPVLAVWEAFESTYSCQRCHHEPEPIANHSFADRPPRDAGDLSRQDEMYRWVRDDKHAIARIRIEPLRADQVQAEQQRILQQFSFADPDHVRHWVGPSNQLSRRICDALGYDVDSPDGYRQFAADCLTCHGGHDPNGAQQPGFDKPAELTGAQPGISCLACHQQDAAAAQQDDRWLLEHASLNDPSRDQWRLLSPQEKAARGMRDLVTISKQAELCIDCHVGNIAKGMFVTHGMYAAGHPPLPNFEMETFCRQMPQHWRSEAEQLQAFSEAEYPGTEEYFAVNYPGLVEAMRPRSVTLDAVAWNTRRAIVGAAAVRRRNAEMIVWAAESQSHWGDYAMYDCGACHHELQRPSLRQRRQRSGAPGRPRLHEWPDVLLAAVGSGAAAAKRQQQLDAAVAAKPFGDPLPCRDAAAGLLEELDKAVQRVEDGFVFTAPVSWQVIQRLSGLSQPQLLDYATARQVIWIVEAAASDLLRLAPESRQLAAVRTELELWKTNGVQPGGVIAAGGVGIATGLPSGREMFIFRENLHEELRRRAVYQPDALAESLQRLQDALAPQP